MSLADPLVARESVESTRKSVVFPAPFGPKMERNAPRGTVMDTLSTARRLPNTLESLRVSMAASTAAYAFGLSDELSSPSASAVSTSSAPSRRLGVRRPTKASVMPTMSRPKPTHTNVTNGFTRTSMAKAPSSLTPL